MRTGWRMDGTLAGLVMFAVAPLAFGQAAPPSAAGSRFLISASGPAQSSGVPAGEIVREIDDPQNGDRWILAHDLNHPGGPGRLVLVSAASMDTRAPKDPKDSGDRTDSQDLKGKSPAGTDAATPAPIIHGGDHVIVEENTSIVEARLEAVAMGPAWAGSPFNVRLSLGGKVVRAVAVEPGRAVLQAEIGQTEMGQKETAR
jgi:hypothetical protein